jgi:PAS domain S-box-containing protein
MGGVTSWRMAMLDITDRKRAEQGQARLVEDLSRSQQHFQALFNWTPSAVGISTLAEGRFIDVNEGFSRLTGYTREEVIGRTTLELGLWADPSERAIVLREMQEQGHLHNREGRLRTKSGEIRSIMVSLHSIQLGSRPCLIYLGHDITERKRVEEALKASERQFAAFMDNLPGFAWIKDAQGRHRYANRLFQEFLAKYGDWKEKTAAELWPAEIAAHYESNDQKVLASEASLQTVEPYVQDGEVRHALVSKFPIEDYKGLTGLMGGVAIDITERKQAEAELSKSEAGLRAILDNCPGMIFLKDLEGRYLHVNRQFERAFHMTLEQVVGKTDEAIFVPEQAAAFRANDLKVLQATAPLEFEEIAAHDDGLHTSIVSKFPLFDEDGKPYALCGITTDITWRKTVEETLRSSDAFTRAVLNSLSAHLCVLDKEGVIVTTNDAWKEFARKHADDTFIFGEVGDNYFDYCRRTVAGTVTGQAILKGIEDVLVGSELSCVFEYACQLPTEERWFLMRVTPLKAAKGVVISHADISRRVRMGLALEQHAALLGEKQKELESLAGKLIEAQEAERKRIARELHDDFNQRLAALSVELESMERTPIALPELITRQLAAIRIQAGMLSDDLHDLAYRLHPSLLEHVGLEVAARDHVAEFAKRTGLSVRFTGREVPKTLSSEVATNLFRVLQESLQNVSKHAQATDVTVRLSGSSKGIGLSVRDNGQGFDLEEKNAGAKGLGLVSMQERTRGLGGFLRIHSLPRSGTKICAWIPHVQEDA